MAVIDTQVALDWLLFGDPAVAAPAAAVAAGQLRWIGCPAMRDEFERVLRRRVLARWRPDPAALLAAYDACVRMVGDPAPLVAPALRCTDPDDQVFLDLALREKARWLLTRDRALLKLARRALPLGLRVVAPAGWASSG